MKTNRKFVRVILNLDKDLLLALALEAHKRDMKLNDLVVEILERAVKENDSQKQIRIRSIYRRARL